MLVRAAAKKKTTPIMIPSFMIFLIFYCVIGKNGEIILLILLKL